MPTTYTYIKGQTDLSQAGTFANGTPPNGDNAAVLVFDTGGQIDQWQNTGALTGVRFDKVLAGPGFASDLGQANGYVQFDCDHGAGSLLDWRGQGNLFLQGGSTNATFTKIVWRPIKPATLYVVSATCSAIEVYNGSILIPSTVATGTLVLHRFGRADVQEHASATITGGSMNGQTNLRTQRIISGAFTVGPGCTLVYDVDSTTLSGLITLEGGTLIVTKGSVQVNGKQGVLDYSGLQKTGYTLTITDNDDLLEKQGPVPWTTINRTTLGNGSQKA